MKKILVVPALGILLLGACKEEQEELTPSAINAKVDSLVGARMEELNVQAMEDLDRRMSIEVKVKADSIVAAATATPAPVAGNPPSAQ